MSHYIFQTGLQNLQRRLYEFSRASEQIATPSNSASPNVNQPAFESLLNVKQAQQTVELSVAVIKVADETLGSVLDALA